MSAAQPWPTIESPCINICSVGDSGHCLGCFRTPDEIARWLSFTDEERRTIIDALPKRAAQLFEDE